MSPAPSPTVGADTLLSCIHSTITTCHYSMVTMFRQHREQMCEELQHCPHQAGQGGDQAALLYTHGQGVWGGEGRGE